MILSTPYLRRVFIPLVSVLSLFTMGACTTVPEREFKAFTAAFDEVKSATEQLIIDLDTAQNIVAEAKARRSNKKEKKAPRPVSPIPLTIDLTRSNSAAPDPTVARRRALEAVSRFNGVLTDLAAGKKPEKIKSSVDSLVAGMKNIASLVGTTLPISGVASGLVSTFIGKLEEAQNRAQFVSALKSGEPIVNGILGLYMQDAQDAYKIVATDAIRRAGNQRQMVTRLVRQMREVAKVYQAPATAAESARLKKAKTKALSKADKEKLRNIRRIENIQAKIRAALDQVGRPQNTHILAMTSGGQAIDAIAFSQLDQTLDQAEASARKYTLIINAAKTYQEMVVSYGHLLRKTKQALTVVRLALDKPADIREQGLELIGFAFDVKRKFDLMKSARGAAAGN